MDHVTRCPNCSTAFRVTDQQLAAYQGKVRCGRCAFVFNAREALLPHTSPPASETTQYGAETPPQQTEPPPSAAETAARVPEYAPPSTERQEPPPVATPYAQTLIDLEAAMQSLETPAVPKQTREESIETPAAPAPTIRTEAADTPSGYHPITLPEDEALFAPIAKPRHSGIWTSAAVLAGFALLLQILFAYRIQLAMEFPALQPRLTQLCARLDCKMPLPRQTSQLRTDWSELTYVPDHPTLIQLSATLRNLALYEQALPLMELTLTDSQERVVARRIFRPKEYLTAPEKNRPSLQAQEELHAFLQLETGELKSTGYSLNWFYE